MNSVKSQSKADSGVERMRILGVGVNAIDNKTTLDQIDFAIKNDERCYICVTPVHSVMDCYGNRELLEVFNNSCLTVPDGMPLVWILKNAGYSNTERVYGPDLMVNAIHHFADEGYRHYLYGAAPGIAEKVQQVFLEENPKIQIAGTHSPPFRDLTEEETTEVIDKINTANPDVIWIALGAPKQEKWMADNRHRLNAPVMLGVGVAFNYIAGTKRQAPRWMRNSGLEWLFRLLTEPRHVWSRYIRYPQFILLIIAQLTGLRRDHQNSQY